MLLKIPFERQCKTFQIHNCWDY